MNSRKAKRLRREAAVAMFAMDGKVPSWIEDKSGRKHAVLLPQRQVLKALKKGLNPITGQ